MARSRLRSFADLSGWQLLFPGWARDGQVQIRVLPDGRYATGGHAVVWLPTAVDLAYRKRSQTAPKKVMDAAWQAMTGQIGMDAPTQRPEPVSTPPLLRRGKRKTRER